MLVLRHGLGTSAWSYLICSFKTLLHLVSNEANMRAVITDLLRAVVRDEQHLPRRKLVRRQLSGRDSNLGLVPPRQYFRTDMVALARVGWSCQAGDELVTLFPTDYFWSVWLRQVARLLRVGDTSSGLPLKLEAVRACLVQTIFLLSLWKASLPSMLDYHGLHSHLRPGSLAFVADARRGPWPALWAQGDSAGAVRRWRESCERILVWRPRRSLLAAVDRR